jgi:hypothetical protein
MLTVTVCSSLEPLGINLSSAGRAAYSGTLALPIGPILGSDDGSPREEVRIFEGQPHCHGPWPLPWNRSGELACRRRQQNGDISGNQIESKRRLVVLSSACNVLIQLGRQLKRLWG